MQALGFTTALSEATGTDDTSVEHMAALAVSTNAVNLDRVLAFYAAQHLMGAMKPSPEDLAALAQWLTGPTPPKADEEAQPEAADEETEEDEEEEDDVAPRDIRVDMRDSWPDVLVCKVLPALVLVWFGVLLGGNIAS